MAVRLISAMCDPFLHLFQPSVPEGKHEKSMLQYMCLSFILANNIICNLMFSQLVSGETVPNIQGQSQSIHHPSAQSSICHSLVEIEVSEEEEFLGGQKKMKREMGEEINTSVAIEWNL